MYVAFAESGPTKTLPLVARGPLQAPEAAHAVASVAFQLSVEVPPAAMLAGLALKLRVGGGVTTVTVAVWLAEPPGPVHVSA